MRNRHPQRGVQLPAALVGGRPPRVERVAKQLRDELSMLVVQEMKDPRVRLASITAARVSPDLRSARVMVSAIGEDADRHAVVQALQHAEGFLRAQLGHRLENLKNIPRLHFELDESIAYSVHVSAILREMGTTDQVARERLEQSGQPGPEDDDT